jgi:hypothetical protein
MVVLYLVVIIILMVSSEPLDNNLDNEKRNYFILGYDKN